MKIESSVESLNVFKTMLSIGYELSGLEVVKITFLFHPFARGHFLLKTNQLEVRVLAV